MFYLILLLFLSFSFKQTTYAAIENYAEDEVRFLSGSEPLAQVPKAVFHNFQSACGRFCATFCPFLGVKDVKEPSGSPRYEHHEWYSIEEVPVIDQSVYESSKYNQLGGALMCGFFAAYNALLLLDWACSLEKKKSAKRRMNDIGVFNGWLHSRKSIIDTFVNSTSSEGVPGNITAKDIKRLLPERCANKITVIEFITLRRYRKKIGGVEVFDPLEAELLNVVNEFRCSKTPHVAILNLGAHWITVLIQDGCYTIADSKKPSNEHRENYNLVIDKVVALVDDIFTKISLPPSCSTAFELLVDHL